MNNGKWKVQQRYQNKHRILLKSVQKYFKFQSQMFLIFTQFFFWKKVVIVYSMKVIANVSKLTQY